MAAARANAGWAYQRLYEAHARPVAAYARGQGSEDPDGLVNDVFLRAFRSLDRFQGDEDGFRAWLFVIARNALIDERRRRDRRPQVTGAVALDGPMPGGGPLPDGAEGQALERIGAQRVREVLGELSPEQRDVLLLRIVADLTVEQVARVLGKQPGAVKQLQRRGLDALRRRLTDEGEW
ncbi:MAG TPA: sigma-70 family RNA polymerase sigma factor [Acidimicrobiales bacterium]|nr:sigma-70 family RNA polymerase sigma factor [Acidimicrobiales bacterium]